MLMEHDLLPYSVSDLPEGPWLVFAPHADDETFGMGGSLLLASLQNIETHVVFVTDGALGGEGDHQALVEKRIQEARTATDALGVTSIYFFAEPDRGLQVSDRLCDKISELLAEIKPRSVFFPTPMEYHPDHRVTTELVWKSIQSLEGFTGDAYAYEISTLAPINLLIDVSAVAAAKYEIIKGYASQLTQAKYLALVQAIDTARTFSLPMDRIAAEGFFKYENNNGSIKEQVMMTIPAYFEGL
jgi:N-acetylglucosamine malate deacetylase 1